MATLLLTHALSDGHGLCAEARAAGHRLLARSMLDFQRAEFALPERDVDWVFAYSPRGVRAFLDADRTRAWLDARPQLRYGAIGGATADAFRQNGLAVAFAGAGSVEAVAGDFGRLCAGQAVVFVQAERSRESVATHLRDHCQPIPIVTYRAVERPLDEAPVADVLLVTSPRSAQVLLASYAGAGASPHPRVFAIGETTAAAVRALGWGCAGVGPGGIDGLVRMALVHLSSR